MKWITALMVTMPLFIYMSASASSESTEKAGLQAQAQPPEPTPTPKVPEDHDTTLVGTKEQQKKATKKAHKEMKKAEKEMGTSGVSPDVKSEK